MGRLIEFWNGLRGYGFTWVGRELTPLPGTCPYHLSNDWSVKRCLKNGTCGCDESLKTEAKIARGSHLPESTSEKPEAD